MSMDIQIESGKSRIQMHCRSELQGASIKAVCIDTGSPFFTIDGENKHGKTILFCDVKQARELRNQLTELLDQLEPAFDELDLAYRL